MSASFYEQPSLACTSKNADNSYRVRSLECLDPDNEGRNMLHEALKQGNVMRVNEYLQAGVNPNILDSTKKRNSVGWAACGGSLECLRALKKAMTDKEWQAACHQPDLYKNLPIHAAAYLHDNVLLFEFLHREGCYSLMETGQNGCNLYHCVFSFQYNFKIFKYINENLTPEQRRTLLSGRSDNALPPLSWYVVKKIRPAVEALLTLPEIDIEQPGQHFSTALFYTIYKNGVDIDTLSLLLEHGANTAFVNVYTCTPLLNAIIFGHYGAAELLLQHGANINQVLRQGNTLLHRYLMHSKATIAGINFLLQHGAIASVFKENIYGIRPFEMSIIDFDDILLKLDITFEFKQKIRASYRKKAVSLSGRRLIEVLQKAYPATSPVIKNGICCGFSFLAALSYFKNDRSLTLFYRELRLIISPPPLTSSNARQQLTKQYANDIVWLQGGKGVKSVFVQKPRNIAGNRKVSNRFYYHFSQTKRKENLAFISDREIYGPVKPITYFFTADYTGDSWVSGQLANAIALRCGDDVITEIFSQEHVSIIIKNNGAYIIIDSELHNQPRKMTINEAVNTLIMFHTPKTPMRSCFFSNIFLFHIRGWKISHYPKEGAAYYSALAREMSSYNSSTNVLNYVIPEGGDGLLHYCTFYDDEASIRAIYSLNPDLDINVPIKPSVSCYQNMAGATPLHSAVHHESYRCVRLLLQTIPGVNIQNKTSDGRTMLEDAYFSDKMFIMVLSLLKMKGIDIYELTLFGLKLSAWILADGDKELIRKFVSQEAIEKYHETQTSNTQQHLTEVANSSISEPQKVFQPFGQNARLHWFFKHVSTKGDHDAYSPYDISKVQSTKRPIN